MYGVETENVGLLIKKRLMNIYIYHEQFIIVLSFCPFHSLSFEYISVSLSSSASLLTISVWGLSSGS